MGQPEFVGVSELGFHQGQALLTLADTYHRLPQTVLEIIQNGLDINAEADRILAIIDLQQREIIVLDNGFGTNQSTFEKALVSVASSVKKQAPGTLGRFGLGLISPLSKCKRFTFTSQPRGRRQPMQWEFAAETIRQQKTKLGVPCQALERMPDLNRRYSQYVDGEFVQRYATEVHMYGVTLDKVIGAIDIDDLANRVSTNFMAPMRKNKAMVRLVYIDTNGRVAQRDVSPLKFTGEPLEVVALETEETGRVEFELFRARRIGGRRAGKISVMELNGSYPVALSDFVKQARQRKVADVLTDAMKALDSGYFEGIIRCENIELQASRSFVYNDALEMLYLVIDQWYDEYGRGQHASEEDQSRHTRWQELGLQSQNRLHQLLHQPEHRALWDALLRVVQFGRLGAGHLDPQHGKVGSEEDDRSKRVGQGGVGTPKTPSNAGPRTPSQPGGKDRPGDGPLTASGPGGRRRRLVKGDSQGLQLAHGEFPGDSRLWNFDFKDGTLTFNTLHPVWVELDETNGKHLQKNSAWILHLQEWLTLAVLNHLMHCPDPDEFEMRRDTVDDVVRPYAAQFIVGGRVRRP